jgi:hypothetical protein
VLVVVVSSRGELTLDGQVHQLAPMVVAHLPKGTVRAIEAVDGPLAYLVGPPPPAGGTAGGSACPATLSSHRTSRGEVSAAEALEIRDGQVVRGELFYDAEALREAMAPGPTG